MPDLYHSLIKQDIGFIRIVAEMWGVELESQTVDSAVEELTASILDPEPVREQLEILHPDSISALTALIETNGKMEWTVFSRRYGELRDIGAGKRDRIQPHTAAVSITEVLYYRGLIDKSFFDTEKGAREFAYMPDDLFELIGMEMEERSASSDNPPDRHEEKEIPKAKNDVPVKEKAITQMSVESVRKTNSTAEIGRAASPGERAIENLASDFVLDQSTTLLAALRMGKTDWSVEPRLMALLETANLIVKNIPQTDAVKKFLGSPRGESLNMLYSAWIDSQTFDELRLIPEISCEGEWTNDAKGTRRFLLDLIEDLPKDKWQSFPALLRDIKMKYPDFQRPAGDYDSWFIKRRSDNQYLRGFAYWDQIEGALIRYLLQTLHWLGRADLASPEAGKEFTAFKIRSIPAEGDELGRVSVSSNGGLLISRSFSRAGRYQLARFCEWKGEKADDYVYRITAESLKQANGQGLKADQLLTLLVKHTHANVPPPFIKALKRWEANGVEARVENLLLLRVSKPEIMEEMRNSKAGKYLGELISPTAVIVKEGAIQKALEALADLGLLAEAKMQ